MTSSTIPDYCYNCPYWLDKMGGCQVPNVNYFYSLVSCIPYLLIFLSIFQLIIYRKKSNIIVVTMLITCYIIGDRILKNILQSPRPPLSCKTSYGMPSSHMVVMLAYSYYICLSYNFKLSIVLLFSILSILQAKARYVLNYHTKQQIIFGAIFGILYAFLFLKIIRLFEKKNKKLI